MEFKQIKVTCKSADLDNVCAVMSMIDNGLMIEDYSDIDDTFKDVYADLIDARDGQNESKRKRIRIRGETSRGIRVFS